MTAYPYGSRPEGRLAELLLCLDDPVGLAKQLAAQEHQVCLAAVDDGLGLTGFGDHADRPGLDPSLIADSPGERNLEPWPDRDLRRGHDRPRGNVDQVNPDVAEEASQHDRLVDVPASVHPVRRGDAHEKRHRVRQGGTQTMGDAQQQAHSILERAAVAVGPLIGERREKLVKEITVRRVDLDELEPRGQGPPGRRLEGRDDAVDSGLIERDGHGVTFGKRDRTGPDDGPAALRRGAQALASFPRQVATRLATGVRKLNSRDGPLRLDEPHNPRQWLNVVIVPDSHVAGGDATLSGHSRRLDHRQGDAAGGPASQVHQVPVVGPSLLRRILTHRRHRDPVAKGHSPDR